MRGGASHSPSLTTHDARYLRGLAVGGHGEQLDLAAGDAEHVPELDGAPRVLDEEVRA